MEKRNCFFLNRYTCKKSTKVLSLYCYELIGNNEKPEGKKIDSWWLYSG